MEQSHEGGGNFPFHTGRGVRAGELCVCGFWEDTLEPPGGTKWGEGMWAGPEPRVGLAAMELFRPWEAQN